MFNVCVLVVHHYRYSLWYLYHLYVPCLDHPELPAVVQAVTLQDARGRVEFRIKG